jgi:hypothetical protein
MKMPFCVFAGKELQIPIARVSMFLGSKAIPVSNVLSRSSTVPLTGVMHDALLRSWGVKSPERFNL